MTWRSLRTDRFLRVGLLGSAVLMGGKLLPKLNTSGKPIEYKYREGNVKRTLKRELKVFETVNDQAMGFVGWCVGFPIWMVALRLFMLRQASMCIQGYFDVKEACVRKVGVWLLAWSLNTWSPSHQHQISLCTDEVHWPVLKHGPRSVTLVRVFEVGTSSAQWKCRRRFSLLRCQPVEFLRRQHRPAASFVSGSRQSTIDTTRKMVSYTCAGWSQGKLWWKLVAVLTCKSFVWRGYRGERPIEPSSSWFPPKFPPG